MAEFPERLVISDLCTVDRCKICNGTGRTKAGDHIRMDSLLDCIPCDGIGYIGEIDIGPTDHIRGSIEKVVIMSARRRQGFPIWHHLDVSYDAPKPVFTAPDRNAFQMEEDDDEPCNHSTLPSCKGGGRPKGRS